MIICVICRQEIRSDQAKVCLDYEFRQIDVFAHHLCWAGAPPPKK